MNGQNVDLVFKDMKENVSIKINKMLASIDVRRSACFKQSDENNIKRAVESVGYDKINKMILDQMRSWVRRVTEESLSRLKARFRKGRETENSVLTYKNTLA